jgi:voltage-gated potassium channel
MVEWLYIGTGAGPTSFRYGLLAFDLVTITFFVISSFWEESTWLLAIDAAIGAVLTIDLGLRIWIARSRIRFLAEMPTIADIIVITSLFGAALFGNFAFLRVLRALRLLRSYHVLRDLRRRSPLFKRNEEVVQSVINLFVFVFVVTALVYVLQAGRNPAIHNYVDALYFTIATLTTTGFGDVTLTGEAGRLLAILIMVFGVGLFLRLVQTIFRPQKVQYTCPDCGLRLHDPDAVHCKHCGRVLHIETEGV